MENHMTGSEKNGKRVKYVIIHGHFYQPPRENPWIDLIENQPSAAPHHDWNERIYDQCYRPNAYSRLLDPQGMIVDIYNNYQNLSYNFGPTLFSWLEQFHPVTAQRIIQSDIESCQRLGGHGNAVAQVYNHIIMPLASRRDQLTQIRWSKYFFRKRYGRDPEGIWLAETAINMETVLCLIEENFKFVILSPNQAESFRAFQGDTAWYQTSQRGIDTRCAYRIFPKDINGNQLPGYLDAFFFDEGLSKEISFGNLLTDAHILGNRINSCYTDNPIVDQVVTIATDGETFGHHKPFGDMCLAYFFKNIAKKLDIVPVNFGYYLSKCPPVYEVVLKNMFGEGTAWSCAHGVGRWTRDCGCQTGGQPGWKQGWRHPLRKALEKLQRKIDVEFEKKFIGYEADPWRVRDNYISVEDCTGNDFDTFIKNQLKIASLDKKEIFAFRRALEAQKYILFSFTSCGWFFSDISGIETIQNLAYACRALQLGIPEESRVGILEEFLKDLQDASSNLPNTNGRTLVERHVLSFLNHEKVLAFTAAAQLLLDIQSRHSFLLFKNAINIKQILLREDKGVTYNGYLVHIQNESTGEESVWNVLVVLRENTNLTGWVIDQNQFNLSNADAMRPELWMAHKSATLCTLADTFQTFQQELIQHFLNKIARDTNTRFDNWRKKHERELDILSHLDLPLPQYCTAPLSFVLQEQWDSTIKRLSSPGKEESVFTELLEMSRAMKRFGITIDFSSGAANLQEYLIAELKNLESNLSFKNSERIRYLLNIVDRFSLPVSKHKLEDMFHPVLTTRVQELYHQIQNNGTTNQNGSAGDNKEMLLKLLNFARRMNFNTDTFKLP